jgi:hypothetical protein
MYNSGPNSTHPPSADWKRLVVRAAGTLDSAGDPSAFHMALDALHQGRQTQHGPRDGMLQRPRWMVTRVERSRAAADGAHAHLAPLVVVVHIAGAPTAEPLVSGAAQRR